MSFTYEFTVRIDMASAQVQAVNSALGPQNERVTQFSCQPIISALDKKRPTSFGFNLDSKYSRRGMVFILTPGDIPGDSLHSIYD